MLKDKKLFLLDMDGTIYLGNRLFEGTMDFLRRVREIGGRYIFLTNNSSKGVDKYIEKLASLGISASEEDFFTSTAATVLYLKKRYEGKKLYAFGTNSFKRELREGGLDITERAEGDVACLVMGFDTELTFKKLEDACRLLARGVDFIATNPDLCCPTEFGAVPDCGSVSAMLYNATGRMPVFIGKPEPAMAEIATLKAGFSKEETLLIGDRLYTDIACGIAAGIGTALVLSGETTREMLIESEWKPEFVFNDIKEIYEELGNRR